MVDWADAGPGTAASGTDYATLGGGTLTFAPNETSKTIAVSVTGDTVDEPDETVVLDAVQRGERDVRGGCQHPHRHRDDHRRRCDAGGHAGR